MWAAHYMRLPEGTMSRLIELAHAQGSQQEAVVFVHGLGGDPLGTWTSGTDAPAIWPKWLAEDIEGLAVWLVGYEAPVSRWSGTAMHLIDRASNVLHFILVNPSLQQGQLTLVGHSLGGLLIKQMLRIGEAEALRNAQAANFMERVRKVAFLGTPHTGADLASLGDRLRILVRPSAATISFVRNDPNLRDLNLWYRDWARRREIDHLILTETKTLPVLGMIVKPDSGDPGLSSRPVPIDADHITIAKPANRDSEIYHHIRNFIERKIARPVSHEEIKIDAVKNDTQVIRENVERLAAEAKFRPHAAEVRQGAYLQKLSDQEIEQETQRLRKARHFAGFPTKEAAMAFADRVDNAELAAGSSVVRSRALAWCARLLSLGETIDHARQLLKRSKVLGVCEEAILAEASILSATDKDGALAMVAAVNSPAARSAALRIVANHDKAEGAVDWVHRCELKIEDFDADGKFALLMNELSVAHWQDAIDHAAKITEEDFQYSPVLEHAVAMACLIQAVPEDLRSDVLVNVPFDASHFPLASDAAALHARRQAAGLFAKASDMAQSFGATTAANPDADYALWLELRDPQDGQRGLETLRASMREPALSLRRLHFALQFGVQLDIASIEKEIDRRVVLSGKGSPEEALARFSLAFAQGSPKAIADYIAKHRTQLYEHLQKYAIQTIEIKLLVRTGLIGAANDKLTEAVADGLGQREEQHLRRIISEFEGTDPASERRKLFERTNHLRELSNLVDLLEEQKSWQELCPYAEMLFARTHSHEDAFRFAKALNESEQYTKLFEFLSQNIELISQSVGLKTIWAWTLYREGRFEDASIMLGELIDARDDENDRTLRINLAIASGNWDELVEFTTDEWNHRDRRAAEELLKAGQLAQAVSAPRAKDLVNEAAEIAPNDAAILAGAYFHATNAGWEQNSNTAQWLRRAAELSDKNGPLKSMSMKEFIDQKPQWDKRNDLIWQQLNEGKIPVFGAAHLLNRSLVEFVLLPSLANLSETDPRRRSVVYAYSGARPVNPLPKIDTIALDLSALFSLARLDLLGTAIGVYKESVIPHSTMGWLFQERQRATFHQPSRIKDAHHVRRLIATDVLSVLQTQPPHDHALVKEVGEELAGLLITAKAKSESGDGIRGFVIRSAPVHRVTSLMEEEADLGTYVEYLCSCQAVVAKMRAKAVLTLHEERQACSYLSLQERSWPGEPTISDGAELYLDDLSVTYLQTVGVLDKLKAAGLTAYVTERMDADTNRLISYESLSAQELDIIEIIRRSLSEGIKSKRIRALRSSEIEGEDAVWLHPPFGVLGVNAAVDAFVVDDRSINCHLHMSAHDRQTPILTTLDLLDDLASKRIISQDFLFGHRTYLRQGGFQLIPLTAEELSYHLENAPLANGALVETAELRAIREAMLRVRMSKMLQIPAEVPWLHLSMNAIIRTLKQIWQTKADPKDAAAYSEWLLELLDVRGWAGSAMPGNERGFALYAYAAHILQIISAPDVCNEVREAYHNWVDDRVLRNIQETEPEVFEWLVERAHELIKHSVETAVAKIEA
jgi:pimeloyl-ACP methyl ester carboxylesterase